MNYLRILLPDRMKGSLYCLTPVKSKAVDGGPDIAVCDENGFFHELKNKKILNSLNLDGKGVLIRCVYVLQNEIFELYYVVLTEIHKLFIIKRTNKCLRIISHYDNVEKFEVYDFDCLGFPQIKINFLSKNDILVWNFPKNKCQREKEKLSEKSSQESLRSRPLSESLEEKLQILNQHIDQLNEEHDMLRKESLSQDLPVEFGMVAAGAVKFCLPLKKCVWPVVKLREKRVKVFGRSLTVGLKICNCGCERISDVELVIRNAEIRDFRSRMFQAAEAVEGALFSRPEGARSVKAGGEVWLFGAFRVPGLLSCSGLCVSWCVTDGDMKRCLLMGSSEVTVLEIAREGKFRAEEELTGEDLMGMRTSKVESHLEVRTEDMGTEALGTVLREELGFMKVKHRKVEMFYCSSGYLNEVLIGIQAMRENPCVWEMILLTSEEAQICVVVNALYEVLSERTRILWREV